ncbi:TetR family transcriptional regulator [Streptomyces justiciae]|uniref:TetR family transcriptional regulator n=1 Tax=Streptomyces justiciae TaxID=2780140 RepID=UPI0018812185|nr:TetR family transcriptional regulator [Streptomyces justiciae]MBE8471168.1 TetR family transcriptional regulator [Streptomyces justiciae]MCW8376962.1 TetR family transcriptional regulator [Streptomyces justiciae]
MTSSTTPDSTRDRIVTAARAEFARYGIAGARITRIAKAAKTSTERLYAYFRSKEELYGFIAEREMCAVSEATRLDPTNLPEYAGRVHDYFIRHPDRYRIMSWGRLELAGDTADTVTGEAIRRKAEQIRKAQEAGQLDPSWEPIDILVFLNQIAMAWAGQLDLVDAAADQTHDRSLAARRAAVVRAVERLFPATGS